MSQFLSGLAVRAATIDELLSQNFEVRPGQKGDADSAGLRLAAWCRASAGGDWSRFERRLARDGITLGYALQRLATVHRRPDVPTPQWLIDAEWIVDAMTKGDSGPSLSEPPASGEATFRDLIGEVIRRASDYLRREIAPSVRLMLLPSSWRCLEDQLCRRLSPILSEPIETEHARYCRSAGADVSTSISPADSSFDAGSASVSERIFHEKPVLLRLIATTIRDWIDSNAEFIMRLESDFDELGSIIDEFDLKATVSSIQTDLSDRHNHGRSVYIVAFDNFKKVVYKPRPMDLDVAFFDLVTEFNRLDSSVILKAARAINRESYGWSEYITHHDCPDDRAIRRFYERSGAWLAIFHALAAIDMHQENVIACGEHPVPVDIEMLFQPAPRSRKDPEPELAAFEAAAEKIENSVATVGLLPSHGRSVHNVPFTVGGLTSDWALRPGPSLELFPPEIPNLPHISGDYRTLGGHLEELCEGFELYAGFIRKLGDDMLSLWLARFDVLRNRRLIRPTQFYHLLLGRLLNPESMNDGVLWSAQADFPARMYDWEAEDDALWPALRVEREALCRLDVPYFESTVCDPGVKLSDDESLRNGNHTGIDRARTIIDALDTSGIAQQVSIIRSNTATIKIDGREPIALNLEGRALSTLHDDTAPAVLGFVADSIDRFAIRRGESAAWIGFDWLGDADVGQLAPLGNDLYNGTPGVAVFLSAHYFTTRLPRSKELALQAVARVRRLIKGRNASQFCRSVGLGAGSGLGSIIYALTAISKNLGADNLLDEAIAAARFINDDLLIADQFLDVLSGTAGCILGLLGLYRASGDPSVLAAASSCGESLLSKERFGVTAKTWKSQGIADRPLNGMSHGASGFAYALSALGAETGRTEFLQAAADCLAFETASFDMAAENWPDYRSNETANFPCQWCHGATGIGLARVAIWKLKDRLDANSPIDFIQVELDIARAIEKTSAVWQGNVDTLCCGALGNIDFLFEASKLPQFEPMRRKTGEFLRTLVRQARSRGDFRWNAGTMPTNLGLFRGLSGVGYTCLRELYPDTPSVLLWE